VRRRADDAGECGAASVLAAVFMSLVLAITFAGIAIGSVVVARHRAQAVADLAALGAAQRLPAGREQACTRAGALTRAMNAHLAQCDIEDLDVLVTVEVAVSVGSGVIGPARAGARAGPAQG
jgi:secretion/DNA translocation related TadE-like protein